jgi:hypothetical protein
VVALVGEPSREAERHHRDVLRALVDAVLAAGARAVRAIVTARAGCSRRRHFTMLAGDVGGGERTPFARSAICGRPHAARSRREAGHRGLHRYVRGWRSRSRWRAISGSQRRCGGLPEVKVGLVPDVGGTTRLVRTVGYARAKELILTGRMISASEALQIGLVTELAPVGTHLEAAIRLAEEIAQNAPLAVGLAKRLIDLGEHRQHLSGDGLLAQSIPRPDRRRARRRRARRAAPAALRRPVRAIRQRRPRGTSS